MMLIGVDYHPSFQTIAFFMEETGECGEQELNHSDGQADRLYRDLKQQGIRVRALPAGGSSPSSGAHSSGLETSVHAPGDASAQKHLQGSNGTQAGGSVVLDVAEWLCVFTVVRVRFARGAARNRKWREVERRPLDWASRFLQREFALLI